jgi:SAM-dependent methyltransferase
LNEQSIQNKRAWEYRAYEFWVKQYGMPKELADKIATNPRGHLKKHSGYFGEVAGKKIANLCGSNGRKAVPLALLGAEVTVFDISEENKRYALELAESAQTKITYIVTDINDIDLNRYGGRFDMIYLEGGILHYFHDLNRFMYILHSLLKEGGEMVLSDFHPLRKCFSKNGERFDIQPTYFDKGIRGGEVSFKKFFEKAEQEDFPDVSVRYFTLSEIINSVVQSGFILTKFDEHPGWKGQNIPWEFTILASKK